MTWRRAIGVFGCVVALAMCGCADNADQASDDGASGDEGAQSSTHSSDDASTYLPDVMSENCEPEHEELETCEWAGATDAVAWVTVDDIEVAPEWEQAGDGEFEVVDSCDSPHRTDTPGLQVTLEVDEALYGDPPGEVTALIGGSVVEDWSVQPQIDDGELNWIEIGSSDESDPDPPFSEGSELGVALHQLEEQDMWTTGGEFLFDETENDDGDIAVEFQQLQSETMCSSFEPPEELAGAATSTFEDAVSNCKETDAAADRRDMLDSIYFDEASWTSTGVCRKRSSDSGGGCTTDADCEDEQVCSDGSCSDS